MTHLQHFNHSYAVRYPRNKRRGKKKLIKCLETMIKSSLLRPFSPSTLILEARDFHYLSPPPLSSSTTKITSSISCSSSNHAYNIPKLEPFSRTKFERVVKEPPLIEKAENELADYCSVLEGDESYSCWRAYFELKDLEKELPKREVEKLILEAGGVKFLIGCLHGIAAVQKINKNRLNLGKPLNSEQGAERHCPVPDGLPKSQKELEEEETSRLPDSPFTRLLRTKGRQPAWYSLAPDHETD